MARAGETEARSPFLQLKAIESLGRLRDGEAATVLRERWKRRRCGSGPIIARFGLQRHKRWPRSIHGMAARSFPTADWNRVSWRLQHWIRPRPARGYGSDGTSALCSRRRLSATISSSWGKSSISIREMSLGGGMGTKEDNLRIGSEANLDISMGVRPCARRFCCDGRG